MTNEQLIAELAKVKAENDALKASKSSGPSFKITEKGGLSVYGMGRFPVTLYKSQWVKLLSVMPEIKAFIEANDAKLADKPKKVVLKIAA